MSLLIPEIWVTIARKSSSMEIPEYHIIMWITAKLGLDGIEVGTGDILL